MERVHADPEICSGKPIIRGTRIMVRNVLSMLKAGKTVDDVLESYPSLTKEDVAAAVDYAIELVDEVRLLPRAECKLDLLDGKLAIVQRNRVRIVSVER